MVRRNTTCSRSLHACSMNYNQFMSDTRWFRSLDLEKEVKEEREEGSPNVELERMFSRKIYVPNLPAQMLFMTCVLVRGCEYFIHTG